VRAKQLMSALTSQLMQRLQPHEGVTPEIMEQLQRLGGLQHQFTSGGHPQGLPVAPGGGGGPMPQQGPPGAPGDIPAPPQQVGAPAPQAQGGML
jgi:hypothetical protein